MNVRQFENAGDGSIDSVFEFTIIEFEGDHFG